MSKVAAICTVVGCGKPKKDGKGKFCAMHKSRMMRYGTTNIPEVITVKYCENCEEQYATNQRNNRAKFCPKCREKKWLLYPVSAWEKSQKGKEYYKKYNLEYKTRLRGIVFDFYGAQCNCCEESNELFLSVDHVNNDGYLDRKEGIIGIRLYKKIIERGFPADYQILCMNCNFAKKHTEGNICPHQM